MENVPLTEVPLLAGKDCIFEVVGDTVFKRPTVYYNICQVWVTWRLPYTHPRTSFLPLCHKEVLNEHFLWFFRLCFLKLTNIGCFVQLNTFRQHSFPYSREILLFTRTGQKYNFSLCFCRFCCWRDSSYCMLACIQEFCHSDSGWCYGQNIIQKCSDIIQQHPKSNGEGNWVTF